MKQITELRIFLASPGDVDVERTIVKEVIDEINITYGTPNGISIKLVNWENYSFPAMGDDPQDVINNQLPFDYDVFLCIFWTRIGTATNRARSGTVEELETALRKREAGEDIEIMGYFKTEPPSSLKDITEQYFEVRKLQKEFGENCLYKEYTATEKFQDIFRIHFTQYLNQKFSYLEKSKKLIAVAPVQPPIEIGNEKRNEIYKKLNSLNLDASVDTAVYDTLEIITDKSSELTIVLDDISSTMNELSEKVSSRTAELNTINNISDTRLKIKKRKIIVNQLANELDVISDKYELYVPEFKNHYLELINSYVSLYSKYEKYLSETDRETKSNLITTIDEAIEALTDLLVEMDSVPKVTSKYGQAQIRQMKLLKELVDEILFGRELLDQIE